uniref:Reverse transcriptase domain-containing protein n=1 Tax=Amphimedon queenslandica TaxID=400682 RepID=A0A1X7TB36_AMPQE
MGQGTGFIKIELQDAYWIVPVHPHDMYLLAITWQNVTYLDRALPFGFRSAPKIFSTVAYMIAWALHCCGLPQQINYLHDFLLFVHPSDQNGAEMLVNALQTLDVLGVPVATPVPPDEFP